MAPETTEHGSDNVEHMLVNAGQIDHQNQTNDEMKNILYKNIIIWVSSQTSQSSFTGLHIKVFWM